MDTVSQAIIDVWQNNKPAALATIVRTRGTTPRQAGAKMLVYPNGAIVGTIGGGEMELRVIEAAKETLMIGQPRVLDLVLANEGHGDASTSDGQMEIFIEPLLSAPTLMIVGAGHVGAAVAQLGKLLGFYVVVIDDRPDLIAPERFLYADERIVGDLVAKVRELTLTPQTYVVLVTRAHALDAALLSALLEKPTAYIGMLGSERRAHAAREALRKAGVSESLLARLHAPIGLAIDAETPQEIAVSILAEIIQIKRKT
jgi:xanthine dehydrogenase accessory factor